MSGPGSGTGSGACPQCGAALRPGAQFCGGCGARKPEPVFEGDADAHAVARYGALLDEYLADGALDADEMQQLEAVRQRLRLSPATHERLLAGRSPSSAPTPIVTLHLAVDVSTIKHFEVDARCLLRLELRNDGELALERVDLHAEIVGVQSVPTASFTSLFPGKSGTLPLWMVPRVAGFQELRGVLHTVNVVGEHRFCAFEAVQFRVGSGREASRVSVVNIDQRSARVVDNSRSSFAAGQDSGLLPEAELRPVPLRALTPLEAGTLVPALVGVVPAVADQRAAATAARATPSGPVRFKVKTERGEYDVHTLLAAGELATIYAGARTADGARVVVKLVDDRDDNDLMQAEVSALGVLRQTDSPQLKHLPTVLDQFHASDGRLGTVMERLDGLDLHTIRARLPEGIPARHLIWLMRRCLSALGFAHSRGVLHGNLDPAHIFVRAQDHNVWLLDWCYAIVDPARTGQRFRALNEVYSPPEVAARMPPLPSSDLYSLGKCMLFAAGGDPAQKTLPDGVDERLARFLKFFVQESPLGRAQDAWALHDELGRIGHALFGAHEFVEFVVP